MDNLTYRTTPEDLRRVFERCGEVGDIYIPRDRFSRESRGFAFVRFYDKRDAEDALEAMDGRMLDGRELRVQMARYGRPTSPARGSRGGRDRGSGGRRRRVFVVVNFVFRFANFANSPFQVSFPRTSSFSQSFAWPAVLLAGQVAVREQIATTGPGSVPFQEPRDATEGQVCEPESQQEHVAQPELNADGEEE